MTKTLLPIAGTVLGSMVGAPWLGGVLGAAGGTAAGAAIGGLAGTALAGSQKPTAEPTAPTVLAPPVMPTPNSQAVEAAKRRSIAGQIQMKGRASTILTQGGLDNSGDKLGA